MIACEALSDRMPDVALEADQWSDAELAHILSCETCHPEWKLVEEARDLGNYHPRNLPAMEASLLARLKSAPVESKVIAFPRSNWRWGVPTLVTLAASVALIFGIPRQHLSLNGGDSTSLALNPIFPEILQLDEAQLQALLQATEDSSSTQWVGSVPRLGDLTESQLQQLLSEVEGGL